MMLISIIISSVVFVLFVQSFLTTTTTSAWIISTTKRTSCSTTRLPTTKLLLAAGGGFGGSVTKKDVKLKPKQQWDRYLKIKGSKSIPVGVKGDDDWLLVGNVKSNNNNEVSTEIMVAKQRALIADHAKRLYPIQITPKVTLVWGYKNDDGTWIEVDKSVLDGNNVPENVEKLIGFEGTPDPNTGFYCIYNEGRLVTGDSDSQRPSSKKLK